MQYDFMLQENHPNQFTSKRLEKLFANAGIKVNVVDALLVDTGGYMIGLYPFIPQEDVCLADPAIRFLYNKKRRIWSFQICWITTGWATFCEVEDIEEGISLGITYLGFEHDRF